MSWATYVDQNLIGAGLSQATIIDGNNGDNWATSKGFSLAPGEGKSIIDGFKNSAAVTASGVVINKLKYFVLKADPHSIYGKKGAGGVILTKTNKAIIVGVYDDKILPGQATIIVEKLAEYLREQNF